MVVVNGLRFGFIMDFISQSPNIAMKNTCKNNFIKI